jgi:beta-lactam-binding protein with PASTA domain
MEHFKEVPDVNRLIISPLYLREGLEFAKNQGYNDILISTDDIGISGVSCKHTLNVSSVEYSPSEYKDLVIAIKYRGRNISSGMRVPEGSSLVLVVGSGLGGEELPVPGIKGMSLEAGTEEALNGSMVIGAVEYDVEPSGNEDKYVIYRQRPAEGKSVPAGTRIDVWLSKDKSMLNKVFEEDEAVDKQENEEFF